MKRMNKSLEWALGVVLACNLAACGGSPETDGEAPRDDAPEARALTQELSSYVVRTEQVDTRDYVAEVYDIDGRELLAVMSVSRDDPTVRFDRPGHPTFELPVSELEGALADPERDLAVINALAAATLELKEIEDQGVSPYFCITVYTWKKGNGECSLSICISPFGANVHCSY